LTYDIHDMKSQSVTSSHMTYMIWSLYQWRVDIWHTWHEVSISDEL